jgi:hypothetical protein
MSWSRKSCFDSMHLLIRLSESTLSRFYMDWSICTIMESYTGI